MLCSLYILNILLRDTSHAVVCFCLVLACSGDNEGGGVSLFFESFAQYDDECITRVVDSFSSLISSVPLFLSGTSKCHIFKP